MEFFAQLHPLIVHFPIAFFAIYFFFELFGIILKKDFLSKSSHLILFLGVVISTAAVFTGNQAYESAKQVIGLKQNILQTEIEKHELFATLTLWYFFALLSLRTFVVIKKKFDGKFRYIFILLGLIGIYFIFMTGLSGGSLVFDFGIGTKIFLK
jgi:uncharacterized membrane protein